MEYIKIEDYFLLLLYVILLYTLVFIHSKKYKGTGLRRYFISAFILHIVGTVLYAMVIQYFYGYGDSFGFFEGGKFIQNLVSSTGDPFTPFLNSSEDFQKMVSVNTGGDFTLPTGIDTDSNLIIMKISALLSYMSFNSYIIISLFFGMFSFIGLWKLFKTLNDISQKKGQRMLAIAILYTPSIWFWGSGLIKDSLCLGCIGLLAYFIHKILIKKKFGIKDPILMFLLFYLLFVIKSYLASVMLISFALSCTLFLILKSRTNIFKFASVIGIVLVTASILILSFSNNLDSILEDTSKNIEVFKGAYSNAEIEDARTNSSFTAVEVNGSLSDIVLKSPIAILTTLFRPFFWEVQKPIMALSALESFLTLLATVFVLLKCRIHKFFRYILSDPYLFFSFTFSLILAAIVGISTFNFGTMVRYRLPILPFYLFMLVYIYIKHKESLLEKSK